VLKQTDRNRRDAWRLAAGVAAVALGLFIGGYATAEWRKGKELEAGEATEMRRYRLTRNAGLQPIPAVPCGPL
jgi:hypothetical protein